MKKLCLLVMALSFAARAEARDIYVRLADKPSSIAVTSGSGMTLVDAGKKTVSLGKSAVLGRSGNSLAVGKNKYALPVRISAGGTLGFNKRSYRGEFLITRDFVLINVLDLEDYVQGVLPAEVGSKWPLECLKVQAIISRTYALRQSMNRSARGYDVVDTVSDQVYKGAGVETAQTNRAVRETAGEVLTYGNDLALTFFHSDSGGHTANNAHVWGKQVPYLCGVKEPVDYTSPNSSWTARIPASQVQSALSKMGAAVGQVREIRVAETDAGGRATKLTFVGSSGSKTVNSSQFRMAVGPNVMKSTMLLGGLPVTKEPVAPPPVQKQEPIRVPDKGELPRVPVPTSDTPMSAAEEARLTRMTAEGYFNSAELMDMLMNPNKRKGYLYLGIQRGGGTPPQQSPAVPLPSAIPGVSMPTLRTGHVIGEENGSFVFKGSGWGHGVGLSQWGAQAMAQQGWKAEKILEHYYPGTTVKMFK